MARFHSHRTSRNRERSGSRTARPPAVTSEIAYPSKRARGGLGISFPLNATSGSTPRGCQFWLFLLKKTLRLPRYDLQHIRIGQAARSIADRASFVVKVSQPSEAKGSQLAPDIANHFTRRWQRSERAVGFTHREQLRLRPFLCRLRRSIQPSF